MRCCGAMKYDQRPQTLTWRASELNSFGQVEYLVVDYSPTKPSVLLSLRQAEILDALEESRGHTSNDNGATELANGESSR